MINKIDLAPYVGASLEVMERDSRKVRGDRPFVFTNLRGEAGLDRVVAWVEERMAQSGESHHSVIDAHAPYTKSSHSHDHGHEHDHAHEHPHD